MVLEWGNEPTGEQSPDDHTLQPGDKGHRKTITPMDGVNLEDGEYGYRHVPVHLDDHDASHDLDDPNPEGIRTRSLGYFFRR